MRKTVLFSLLILGIGVSINVHAEDYCALSAGCHSTPENPLQICADLKKQCTIQQNASASSSTPTQNNTNSYTNNYDLEVSNCLNDFTSEYKKFKTNYDTVIDKKNYTDALTYIENMQDYLANMKNSVCYATAKNNIIGINNSLTEIYKSISKLVDDGTTQDKKFLEDFSIQLLLNIELDNAIKWMYNNGLTSLNTITNFMGEDYLTREQASKFFVQFGKKFLGKVVDSKKRVTLGDLTKANTTLQSYIKEANQLWLFKWVNGKFLPFNKLTRAQAIAVIIRANNWQQNEKTNPWYMGYYNIINNYWLLTWLSFDVNSLDSTNIKRKEIALLLYRLNNYILSDDSSIKLCQKINGEFSTSDWNTVVVNWVESWNCTCKEWYGFNKDGTKCIEATDKMTCQDTFWEYSYTDWTLNDSWGYNCFCKEWYDRESDAPNSPCVKK